MLPTVKEIEDAYEKIGYTPCVLRWIDVAHKTCCPLTAVLIEKGVVDPCTLSPFADNFVTFAKHYEVSVDSVIGFAMGLDNLPLLSELKGELKEEFVKAADIRKTSQLLNMHLGYIYVTNNGRDQIRI
jgi:hypothetical protein